jgi:hypothetical protein
MTRHVTRGWPIVAVVGLLATVGFAVFWRGRWETWGATPAEAVGEMPGDALLPDADLVSTRAIGIAAPPEVIWPWLVQMGSGRGGAYTYDWIENLFKLDMHSADEILAEFQDLAVGDVLPLGAGGPRMRVEILDRDRVMAVKSEDGAWVWTFVLTPVGGTTRLVSRNRIRLAHMPQAVRAAYSLVMTPGSLIMERKMLSGIKDRAERLAAMRTAAD